MLVSFSKRCLLPFIKTFHFQTDISSHFLKSEKDCLRVRACMRARYLFVKDKMLREVDLKIENCSLIENK